MRPRQLSLGELDPEFVTIHFMQGQRVEHSWSLRRLWVFLGLGACVFALVGLRVWEEMQIVKLGYQLNQIRQQQGRLSDEQQQLLVRRNTLANLQRVDTVARQRLGLRPPDAGQIVFLADPAVKSPGSWQRLTAWGQAWLLRLAGTHVDSRPVGAGREAGVGGQGR
jgi:cell division protein FtsL